MLVRNTFQHWYSDIGVFMVCIDISFFGGVQQSSETIRLVAGWNAVSHIICIIAWTLYTYFILYKRIHLNLNYHTMFCRQLISSCSGLSTLGPQRHQTSLLYWILGPFPIYFHSPNCGTEHWQAMRLVLIFHDGSQPHQWHDIHHLPGKKWPSNWYQIWMKPVVFYNEIWGVVHKCQLSGNQKGIKRLHMATWLHDTWTSDFREDPNCETSAYFQKEIKGLDSR